VQALKRSARELIEGSRDDPSWVKVQMQELSTRWETVCALSVSKQTRLEAALRQVKPLVTAGCSQRGTRPCSARLALRKNWEVPTQSQEEASCNEMAASPGASS
jgi:hypothetical protein